MIPGTDGTGFDVQILRDKVWADERLTREEWAYLRQNEHAGVYAHLIEGYQRRANERRWANEAYRWDLKQRATAARALKPVKLTRRVR